MAHLFFSQYQISSINMHECHYINPQEKYLLFLVIALKMPRVTNTVGSLQQKE